MEDVDLAARSGAIGKIRILPEAVLTSGRRWESAGVLRMTGVNLACLVGARLGVPPARLAAWRDALSLRLPRRPQANQPLVPSARAPSWHEERRDHPSKLIGNGPT